MQSDSKRKDVLDFLITSPARQTPLTIEKYLRTRHRVGKRQIREIIKSMVDAGRLVYTYEFGQTFLEISYHVGKKHSLKKFLYRN